MNYQNNEEYLNSYLKNLNNLEKFYINKPYRSLAYRTNFKFCDIMSDFMRKKYGLYKFDVNNEIIKDNNFENINNELNTSGYFITNIDPSLCDTILDKLKKTKCKNRTPTTIWCEDMSEILNIDEIQNLVTDSNLLTIVQNFLNCKPILSQTNYWKSITGKTNDAILTKNAQKFHRDFDHEKWIKIFIYLNDINNNNGPHCFVKGSQNKIIPNEKWGRHSDSWILQNFNKDDIKYFTGKKGTIIFENTRGFHKGTHVLEKERNILQLEFSINKQYASGYPKCINLKNPNEKFKRYNKNYPYVYQYINILND